MDVNPNNTKGVFKMLQFSIITLSTFVTILVSTTRYIASLFKRDISYYLPIFAIIYGIILSVCGYYFTDVEMGNNIIEAVFIGLSAGAGACGINQVGKQLNKKGNQTEGDVPPTVQLPNDEIADDVAQNESEDSDDTNIDIP